MQIFHANFAWNVKPVFWKKTTISKCHLLKCFSSMLSIKRDFSKLQHISTYPFSLCFLSRLLVKRGPFFGDEGDILVFSVSPTVDNGVPFDFLCKLDGVPTSIVCILPLLPKVFRNESINLAPSLGFEGMETPNISQLLRWRSWYRQSNKADRVRSCKTIK